MKSRNNSNLIFINKNLNYVILKNKKNSIYFYNNKFFFLINFLKKENFYLNKNLNCITNYKNNNSDNSIKLIKNIINELTNFYYKKIIFNGKGFKLKKKSNSNFFFFNNSHLKILFENKSKIIKNSKNSFLFLYKNKFNEKSIFFIKNLFKFNIFTKKGIKLNRNLVLVKKIKKK